MCGIVGAINFKLVPDEINGVMYHRGPDEQHGFNEDNVDFYHLRLSILDIAGGVQPMHLKNRYSIIFNGEIYNHQEVRKQFSLQGQTSSDTETLLLLYEKFGENFLHHLDGMFVFAIYDRQEKKIFIARDRAGKKPLYIFKYDNKVVFASELNCLNKLLPLEINHNNFYHYTRLGAFYRNTTPYKHVKELAAGTHLIIDCKSLAIKETRWWNIHEHYLNRNDDELQFSIEKTKTYLDAAVKRRLESSDLEVGCFLSGGIDSGLI